MKMPAYGKQVMQRRKLGERIGLLVVAVHDWEAGAELSARSGSARIVVDVADLPHELEWSCAIALDCVLVGDCHESVLYAAATMLFAAGAASIWAEYPDGIHRLQRDSSPLFKFGFFAAEGPFQPARFGTALAANRSWCLMRSEGVYGAPMFDLARAAEFEKTFGVLAAKAQSWMAEKLGITRARAA